MLYGKGACKFPTPVTYYVRPDELLLWAWGGTGGLANYCFPMFMTLFRFHNSTEHGGFECTFLIYQALYQVIRPFSRQTPHFHKSLRTKWKKMLRSDGSNPKICPNLIQKDLLGFQRSCTQKHYVRCHTSKL